MYAAIHPPCLSLSHKIALGAVWIIFSALRICGRIRVVGGEHVLCADPRNLLLTGNHPSLLDPFISTFASCMPRAILRPERYGTWHTPNASVMDEVRPIWLRDWVMRFPLLPLKTDKNGFPSDTSGIRAIPRALSSGKTFIMFFEGSRTHLASDHRITAHGTRVGKAARDAFGFIVAAARPTVIPFFIAGSDRVLPPDAPWTACIRNIWRERIVISFGPPVSYTDIIDMPKKLTRDDYVRINERIRDAVMALDAPEYHT